MRNFAVNKPLATVCIDSLNIETCGLIRLSGWSFLKSPDIYKICALGLPNGEMCPTRVYRTFRPDVMARHGPGAVRSGFVAEFILAEAPEWIQVLSRENGRQKVIYKTPVEGIHFQRPAYENLFDAAVPLRRTDIYGSGPPVDEVSGEVQFAAQELDGEILDFGCGSGALVRWMRNQGKSAFGLELDREGIRSAVREDVRPFIRLYDGGFPSPLQPRSFDAVISTEVLEHIEDYRAALAEMARLTRDRLVVTTPDMSSIPALFTHQVVPWHLLEATHVSFFTQNSLESSLREFFADIEIARVGPNSINGTVYYTSLMALCRRPLPT
jgi:2-polyprenyl-3-methyl-5-hydroxy-6-metoxy-1,4-benzoquinol methylase